MQNPTELSPEEQQQVLSDDLSKKLRLEVLLAAVMLRLYKRISYAGMVQYRIDGGTVDASQFRGEIQSALERHYRKTFEVFKNPFPIPVDEVLALSGVPKAVFDYQVAEQKTTFLDTQPGSVAADIITTAQARWDNDIAQLEVTLAREHVAKAARDKFNADSEGAADRVGLTETQNGAESGRFFVAGAALAGLLSAQKTWMTITDGRQRLAHDIANGQTVPIYQAFRVMGERLRYPRDVVLGATAPNVINCRCSVAYGFSATAPLSAAIAAGMFDDDGEGVAT